ncbi:hypothetical protein A8B75_00985 [Sphingomonadales bacterium EhC05]|nr:hypothetical protein A8B75_00985 [Sphingomonadales bacterium EhC05]
MGQSIEKTAGTVLAVLALVFAAYNWLHYANPQDYLSVPGEWEDAKSGDWDEASQIELQANVPIEIEYEYYKHADKGMLVVFDAEGGSESVTVEASLYYQPAPFEYRKSVPVTLSQLAGFNDKRGQATLKITSDRNQVFRIANRWHTRDDPSYANVQFGYVKDLCLDAPNNCLKPIETIELPRTVEMVKANAVPGALWAGGFMLLAIIFKIGTARVIAVVFPSPVRQRVDAGLNTDGKYAEVASNPLSRSVDIEELDIMLAEARTNEERLNSIEEERRSPLEEEEDMLAEHRAKVEELQKATEKLDKIQERNRKLS